jgi:hypothetical protein
VGRPESLPANKRLACLSQLEGDAIRTFVAVGDNFLNVLAFLDRLHQGGDQRSANRRVESGSLLVHGVLDLLTGQLDAVLVVPVVLSVLLVVVHVPPELRSVAPDEEALGPRPGEGHRANRSGWTVAAILGGLSAESVTPVSEPDRRTSVRLQGFCKRVAEGMMARRSHLFPLLIHVLLVTSPPEPLLRPLDFRGEAEGGDEADESEHGEDDHCDRVGLGSQGDDGDEDCSGDRGAEGRA